jgi:hypothetical protein
MNEGTNYFQGVGYNKLNSFSVEYPAQRPLNLLNMETCRDYCAEFKVVHISPSTNNGGPHTPDAAADFPQDERNNSTKNLSVLTLHFNSYNITYWNLRIC